jgi:hypothetical protein
MPAGMVPLYRMEYVIIGMTLLRFYCPKLRDTLDKCLLRIA